MGRRRKRCNSLLLLLLAACGDPRDGATSAHRAAGSAVPTSSAGTRVDSLLRLGDSTYRESPDSARRLWSAALDEASRLGDSANIARALTGLGQAARLLGDFRSSRRLGEQALALKLRLGMHADLFRSYNALGLLAWKEERLTDANTLLTRAVEAARRQGDSVALVKAVVNTGNVALDLGDFARARRLLRDAGDAARALGDSMTWARASNDLAALEIRLGDPVGAVADLETARRVAVAVGDSVTEMNARGQLATAYHALGEPQRAFALLDSAIGMARRSGLREEEAANLKLLADLFADAGDHQHALAHYRRALVVVESLVQPEERGNILRDEARSHAALGNLALATRRAAEARRIHREARLAYPEMFDLVVLAELATRASRLGDAASHLREARAIAGTLDAPIAGAHVAIADGALAAAQRDWTRVLHVLDGARASLPLAGSDAEVEALELRARAHAGLGQVEAAIAAGRQAVAAVERVRHNYASGELRTTYATQKVAVYAEQVLLLLRAGRTEEAFGVADAARGRALLEHLAAARGNLRFSRLGGDLLAREGLLRRIGALVARLQEHDTSTARERSPAFVALTAELRDSLLAARAEYEALLARSAVAPSPALAIAAPLRRSAADVRRSLRPGEMLLEYLVTPERLIVFVVTPERVTSHEVQETAANLASRVQLARELLRRRDQDPAARLVLRALHQLLLGPVVRGGALAEARRLIVVPHGVLTYLPFAALVDPGTERYLAETHALLRLPTSAALPALRGARAYADAGVAGGAEVFAPYPDSLPGTRDEASSVERAVRGTSVWLARAATERRLRDALQRSRVVHIASHARLNPRNPLFSRLELAGARADAPADDGALEVHELLGLRVGAPLVFLSGCETALGASWSTRFDAGEEYATIAQALLFAGAGNVVATLWRIDDAGAAEFARHFYASAAHDGVTDALARAQRAMLADPRYRSPFYWAAYEISGGGVALPLPRNSGLSFR